MEATPQGREAPSEASWDRADSCYDSLVGAEGSEFHRHVVIPGTVRLLDLQRGEKVLDLGCGQGVLSRALCQHGAQVTGVDLSQRLIQMARQRSHKAIRYLVADARHLEELPDASFDAIASVLAIQNVEPTAPVFAECARLLRPGGRLVLVLSHPAFRIPRQSRWGWDEERKLMFRAVDRYLTPLQIPIDTRPFRAPGQVTWTYHRPLQVYITELAAAGMWVNALEEWPSHKVSQPGPVADAENRARAEFPLFLAMRALRMPGAASSQERELPGVAQASAETRQEEKPPGSAPSARRRRAWGRT
ncbi:MAG: class I SAM-dependent methyltransferase [Chloroflexi bacterium]|nr:class I SAM-dependent methyltransferase [Chloroflexota bacterium]